MNYYHTDYPDGRQDCPTVSLYHTRKILAARKQHKCQACPQPILLGSPYVRSVYVEDGVFGTFRCHVLCPSDREEYERDNYGALL